MLNKGSIHALELRWEESLLHLWCDLAHMAYSVSTCTKLGTICTKRLYK